MGKPTLIQPTSRMGGETRMKILGILSTFVTIVFLSASTATAIAINFSPSDSLAQLGDSLEVDITVSELNVAGQIVSSYDLDIGYDATLLTASGVTFGPYLDDLMFPGFSLQDADFSTPGLIDIAELPFLSDAELFAQQPDSFILATLSFDTIASGSSSLFFLPDAVLGIDIKGLDAQILDLSVGSASITVTESIQPVPEPATLLLLGMGLLLQGTIIRRAARRS